MSRTMDLRKLMNTPREEWPDSVLREVVPSRAWTSGESLSKLITKPFEPSVEIVSPSEYAHREAAGEFEPELTNSHLAHIHKWKEPDGKLD